MHVHRRLAYGRQSQPSSKLSRRRLAAPSVTSRSVDLYYTGQSAGSRKWVGLMSDIAEFGRTAKSLARNPLGIIALFIVLVYAFAALLIGASGKLEASDRYPIVWFLVAFPPVVLGVFGWLVSCHHEKLYAPRDFQSDDAFLNARLGFRPQLVQLDKQIEEKVTSILTAQELIGSIQSQGQPEAQLRAAAARITQEIRSSSFITVDARDFSGDQAAVFEYPISAFSSLSDLLNEIYNQLAAQVGPFEYGYTWVLRNKANNAVVESARMLKLIPPGKPLRDRRSLSTVGVFAGNTLVVTKPNT